MAQGHVRKSRNHRNDGFEGPPMSKSKSYKFKMEENNTTELLSIAFSQTQHKKDAKIAKNGTHESFAKFSLISQREIRIFEGNLQSPS